MQITGLFDAPLYTGGSVSSLVPSVFPVAINGRPYDIDTLPETFYVRWNTETIPLLRQQADQSDAPAEASLNPQGLWRRAQDSFHHGAGQQYRDRDKNADAYRFRASKGVDVWTRYQLGLLPDTDQKLSDSSTNTKVVAAGARLYYAAGSTVKYTTDITPDSPTWSSVTYAGGTVSDICSDGYNVYVTDGSDIYVTTTASTTLTATDTTDATVIAYVKARFMAAKANTLYNIPTLGSASNVMTFAHPNAGFTWVGFAEGVANIYAAGYAGDKSLIYRIAVKPDASTLDAPIVAGELPDGEVIYAISGYLGFVFLGTSLGVRFCDVDAQGNLSIGPVIETGAPVYAFEPQDRFMWFGWTDYDGTSTGLGRIDLTQFVDTLQPAYASDLMTTGAGTVLSAASFQGLRVFTVAGLGVFAETVDLVASGTLDTGQMGFGIPDPKNAVSVDVRTRPLAGSYTVAIAVDDGSLTTVGSESTANDTGDVFPTGTQLGERFELEITLARDAVTTTGPTVLRWTLKVLPTTADGPAEISHIPLKLYPVLTIRGTDYFVDVEFERAVISSLRATRQVIQYQEFNTTYTGIITDWKWYPYGKTDEPDGSWGEKGTLLVDFQRIN